MNVWSVHLSTYSRNRKFQVNCLLLLLTTTSNTHTYTHAHMHAHTHTHTCTLAHTHSTHTHMYMQTYSHAHSQRHILFQVQYSQTSLTTHLYLHPSVTVPRDGTDEVVGARGERGDGGTVVHTGLSPLIQTERSQVSNTSSVTCAYTQIKAIFNYRCSAFISKPFQPNAGLPRGEE